MPFKIFNILEKKHNSNIYGKSVKLYRKTRKNFLNGLRENVVLFIKGNIDLWIEYIVTVNGFPEISSKKTKRIKINAQNCWISSWNFEKGKLLLILHRHSCFMKRKERLLYREKCNKIVSLICSDWYNGIFCKQSRGERKYLMLHFLVLKELKYSEQSFYLKFNFLKYKFSE